MLRRSLSYHEIALLELLRESDTLSEGSWDDLVSGVADAVARQRLRVAAVARAVEGEHNPIVRERFATLRSDLAGAPRASRASTPASEAVGQ